MGKWGWIFLLHHFYITPVFFFLFHSSAGKNKNKNKSYHWSLGSCLSISTEAWVPVHVFVQSLCVFMEYHLISRHNYAWKHPRTLSLSLPLTNRLQIFWLLKLVFLKWGHFQAIYLGQVDSYPSTPGREGTWLLLRALTAPLSLSLRENIYKLHYFWGAGSC